jgi:hypothetical protein
MGYETEMLIGKVSDFVFSHDGDAKYFQVYATIDMCKMGYEGPLCELDTHLAKGEDPVVYWYAPTGDGNAELFEDRYGDIPKPVPIKDVLEALEKTMEQEGEPGYRRFKWAHALLSSMVNAPEDLSVLFWGY